MQPGYKGSRDEWLNCDSIIEDALGNYGGPRFTTRVQKGEERPGDWLLDRDHISMVLRPTTRNTPPLVVDCSPRHEAPNVSTRTANVGVGYPWGQFYYLVRPKNYT